MSIAAPRPAAPLVLRCGAGCRRWTVLALFAVWAFALGVTAAAGAIWISPLHTLGDGALLVELGLAVLLGGGLLAYAGLGRETRLHVDPEARVLREVLHRAYGPNEQTGAWRFEEFDGIEIRQRRCARRMTLTAELRLRGRWLSLPVAQGELHEIAALARRLETEMGLRRRPRTRLFRRHRRRRA